MKNQTEFSEFVKDQLRQWRAILDDMEVQMNLGKAEFKETFEREKKNFEEFVKKQREQMKSYAEKNEAKQKMLRDSFEALKMKLDEKGWLENEAEFKNQQPEVLCRVFELENALRENAFQLDFLLRQNVETFKPLLDNFRLKLALLAFESVNELEKPMEMVKDQIEKILEKFDRRDTQDEKIDQFMDELTTSYEHFKKAFTGL
ncbi:MAG TPA: hypothetical protein PKC40_13095, partial [Saprospiraceae bacterium]|nr:hypothetical protein [Saprospiraceae bacterium]